jgi:hypothetical protein
VKGLAAVAAFAAPTETGLYRGWDSTLESLSERDPYALFGPRYYLPLSYYPRYFGARLCDGPHYG